MTSSRRDRPRPPSSGTTSCTTRLPEGYTGVNGFTKEEEDSFSVYEFLKKQERAKLHEAVVPREASALQKPAAHPALADEEKQD